MILYKYHQAESYKIPLFGTTDLERGIDSSLKTQNRLTGFRVQSKSSVYEIINSVDSLVRVIIVMMN